MPRTARTLVDGGIYHILTRGNNRQTLFHQDSDYQRYLLLLSTYVKGHAIKLYHYALMPNHVHLIVETPIGAALSRMMSGLNLSYTLFYRKRHRYTGHLWQGRFHSLPIEKERCLLPCARAVELNPVRGKLSEAPGEYPWSSYAFYGYGNESTLLTPNPLYELLGSTSFERQTRYRQFIDEELQQHLSRIPSHVAPIRL